MIPAHIAACVSEVSHPYRFADFRVPIEPTLDRCFKHVAPSVRIDYRIRSDNAWLTVAYTRSKFPPWPLEGGRPGSPNYILVVRANGETERYSVAGGLTLHTDDIIRVMTGTGAGWGDPMKRDPELVKDDLKNGYITEEQANRYYSLDKRSG